MQNLLLDCKKIFITFSLLKLRSHWANGREKDEQELSHDSIARLNCVLPITKTISVIR